MSLLFSRFAKPTREHCGSLARQLILKHPFMKDDMGNGYVSGNYMYMYLRRLILVCRYGMRNTTSPLPSCEFLYSFVLCVNVCYIHECFVIL